ncbi:hypothetical protein L0F63_004379, partial [Massospora cicadina]
VRERARLNLMVALRVSRPVVNYNVKAKFKEVFRRGNGVRKAGLFQSRVKSDGVSERLADKVTPSVTKRRGRPPKRDGSGSSAAIPDWEVDLKPRENFAVAQLDAGIPKKRGRPPKARESLPIPTLESKPQMEAQGTIVEPQRIVATPKKRGRPPKAKGSLAAPTLESKPQMEAQGTIVEPQRNVAIPKKRGRPSKAVAQELNAAVSYNRVYKEFEAVTADPQPATTPKRRGRPPKVARLASLSRFPETKAKRESRETVIQPSALTPRRRGRPPKQPQPAPKVPGAGLKPQPQARFSKRAGRPAAKMSPRPSVRAPVIKVARRGARRKDLEPTSAIIKGRAWPPINGRGTPTESPLATAKRAPGGSRVQKMLSKNHEVKPPGLANGFNRSLQIGRVADKPRVAPLKLVERRQIQAAAEAPAQKLDSPSKPLKLQPLVPPAPPKAPPKAPPAMTEYEKQRLETIRQNQAFLESLNIGGVSLAAGIFGPVKVDPARPPKPLKPKKKAPLVAPRKSLRIQNRPAPAPQPLPEAYAESMPRGALKHKQRKSNLRAKSRQNWDLPVRLKRYDLEASKLGQTSLPALEGEVAVPIIESLRSLEVVGHLSGLRPLPSERLMPQDDEILAELERLRLVTEPPVKLLNQIPTTLDVHSDPSRLLIGMGNREGQVALWDATDLVLGRDTAAYLRNGLLGPEAPHLLHQPHEQPILGLKFHPGHPARLLNAGGDGSLRSLDVLKGISSTACQLTLPNESITGLDVKAATPNSAYFVTSHGFLGHHDLRTSRHVLNSQMHHVEPTAMRLWCLAQNPTRPHLVAVGSSERTLTLWDLRYMRSDPQPLAALRFSASVTSLDWDPRGTRLVSLAYDHQVRFFSLDRLGKEPMDPQLGLTGQHPHHGDPWRKGVPVQARFHPDPALDGRLAVCGAEGPQINFYAAPSGRSLGCYAGHYRLPAASPGIVAFHPSATLLGPPSPLGSAMVHGTLSGRVLILV